MKRALLYGAFGGVLGGLVLGIGAYVFVDVSFRNRIGEAMNLGESGFVAALLLLPFALAGALLGGFCAYIVFFGCRELMRFLRNSPRIASARSVLKPRNSDPEEHP